jgi:hypothetical protein
MGRLVTGLGIGAMLVTLTAVGQAQSVCPAEIGQAKELLSRKGGLQAQDSSQPSKSLAGARKESDQVAGTQWTGKLIRASRLVQEAEAACKTGDLNTAKAKAESAIAELQ